MRKKLSFGFLVIYKSMAKLFYSFRCCFHNSVLTLVGQHIAQHFLYKEPASHGHFLIICPFSLSVIKKRRRSITHLISRPFHHFNYKINTSSLSGSSGDPNHYQFLTGPTIDNASKPSK